MRVIERIAEHYDVQEVPFGRSYHWSPEQVVLACSKCGKKLLYKRSEIIGSEVIRCECGKANTARIREELVLQLLDGEYEADHHPWRYWHTTRDSGLPA
jgi:DNA-directed RNA polymerase subunit RPC12/RpoP